MIKRKIIIILILVSQFGICSPQLPDLLIYKNDTINVYNLILEEYLNKNNFKKQGDLFGLSFRDGASLNCWRGYQAIYKIDNDSLFLINIIDCGEIFYKKGKIDLNKSNDKIKTLFGSKFKNGKVFIDWFNGNINIKNGELLRWDGVFKETYEKEISLILKKGILKETLNIENYIDDPNKINRKFNDTLRNIVFEKVKHLDWEKLDDECECGSEKYIITIGKNGSIKNIKSAEHLNRKEIKDFWGIKEYNTCIKILKKNLSGLKFDIIKNNNKRIEQKFIFHPWYDHTTKTLENWSW